MGGDIALNSQLWVGSRFSLTLPVEISESAEPESSQSPAPPGPVFPPVRLLIADDDPASRRLLVAWLTGAGFLCVEVADGEAVLATAALRPGGPCQAIRGLYRQARR